MDYLDTSVLVAALTSEAETKRIQAWLIGRDPERLAISDWVRTEFAAALSIKVRTGQIDAEQQTAILAAFVRLAADSLISLDISRAHYRTAAGFAGQHVAGLRAGDALHLAIAGDHGATLYTLDKRLAAAGTLVGVRAALV